MGWWNEDAGERFWLELTDREDIGVDLRAPVSNSAGRADWRYALFREASAGDVVFHYDGKADAITSLSTIAGPAFEQPIVWAARGSYARERGAQPVEVPGYAIPLRDHQQLPEPVTLERLRAAKSDLVAMTEMIQARHPRSALYFPFELSDRPVRPLQGYAFKLPADFVAFFKMGAGESDPALLTISSDRKVVAPLYRRWREALLDGAVRSDGLWTQPGERFVFRNQENRTATRLGNLTALGVDPSGQDWAVQINEAKIAGDLDTTSAIAFDGKGRAFLLRQGRLSSNAISPRPILYKEFERLTGLKPAHVVNGNTAIARDWYIVTPLDVGPEEIRLHTALFIDSCASARSLVGRDGSEREIALAAEINAEDEAGGFYTMRSRPALPERQLRRLQGEVWLAMARQLRAAGLQVSKPRHAAGYEVDAEISGGAHQVLVEIKSGASANDVHTGVGQLLLYPALLPRLAGHRRILLLPKLPKPALLKALGECDISVCAYRISVKAKGVNVQFSTEFLELCGA
ncbi:hypothetical protein K3M67_14135 [Sphingobium sp. V4]|uniref:hypothetical protein n=1 Tax=Sphingobium sp. V4 TaxID=3038927 RepID=UPI0025583701|nr:hypothetical protein [Sphingobium sp. V4]WIW88082.1 hypothetical protein K3M67_14135 [Sphingobium sp. V4]